MKTVDNKSTLSRDVLAYIPVKLVPAVTGLLGIIFLTRNLAPEEYGRYAAVVAAVLLIVQLMGTWLSNSVLYFFPEERTPERKYGFWRQTINLQLILALPAMALAYIAINAITKDPLLSLTGSALTLLQLTHALMLTFFQSSRKIHHQAIVVSLQGISQIIALLLLVLLYEGKEVSAIVALITGFAVGNVFLILFNRQVIVKSTISTSALPRELIGKLIKYGVPMSLWFFATQFYMIGDRMIFQYFGITEQVGQYTAFRDLAIGCAGFLTMPLLMATHPIIMEKWKSKHPANEIAKIIKRNTITLSILFAPLVVGANIIGNEVVTILFGYRYALSSDIMTLVVFSIYVSSIAIHLQKGLEVTGQTLLMAKLALFTATFFLIISLISIPKYGVIGGAIGSVFASCLYVILLIKNSRSDLLPKIPFMFWLGLIVWILLVKIIIFIAESLFMVKSQYINNSIIKFLILLATTLFLYVLSQKFFQLINLKEKQASQD